ncbi:hypothetical protein Plhal703r1_c07g0039331 [Plasmopara halstedii]
MASNSSQETGFAAKQATAAAAAQFAGYSSFYAKNSPAPPQIQQQAQFYHSAGLPPPRPSTFAVPRGPPPPRPPPLSNHVFRPPPPPKHLVLNGRGPPPLRPPPRPTTSSSPWQWSNGTHVQATALGSSVTSAPPVKFKINPQVRGPPPRSFRPPPGLFSAPTPAAPVATASPMGGNIKWPDALHDYVKRAFARCKGAADQTLTQNSLKEMITNAIMSNSLWTKNWTAEPLPMLVGDTSATTMQIKMGTAGPVPAVAGCDHASSLSSNSTQPIENPEIKTPSRRKNKGIKRKNDGFVIENADLQRKDQRRQRFCMTQKELDRMVTPDVDTKKLQVLTQEGDLDLAAMVIKGTSQTVEKEYLRLTSPPHPSTVRPEPVLHKSLELVKSKWKQGDGDYLYACSQLKSIRQDCTVQHIKNEFTVSVYETHARVALESGDINEFNQCQTQLHELYEKLIPGEVTEFLAYRILYCVYVSLQSKKGDSNAGQLGMYNVLAMVTPSMRSESAIAHALDVRAPNMAGYLMDVMVPAIRLSALRAMCKAYRPALPVQHIRKELKLEGKAGKAFIRQSGLAFVKGDKLRVDTKSSNIVWTLSDASSLI